MQGFISYSHDDYDHFKELQRHLKQIELGTGFDFWCDERINAGYDWDESILTTIRTSRVFLLLASPNYFAASYVIGRELPAIRNSQRIDDALLIPVILAPCDWEDLLKVPQAVPIGENRRVKPIMKWDDKADGFNAVREQIKATLAKKFGLKSIPLIGVASPPIIQTEKGLAELRRELRLMGRIAGSVASDSRINQPEIIDRLNAIASLGERLAGSAAEVPTADMLGHLVALKNIVDEHPLTDIDPDSDEPIGERLRARGGLGNIMLSLDKAIKAARLAGFKLPADEDDDARLKSVPRSGVGAEAIGEIVEQLERVNVNVEALRRAVREEPSIAGLPREMVDNFAHRVEVQAGLATLELANENHIDLGAVLRNVAQIERLSETFFETAAAMRRVLSQGVQRAAGALKRSAAAARTTVQRLVARILRERGPRSQPPDNRDFDTGNRFRDFDAAPEMIGVPAGAFLMGSPYGEGYGSERPQHKVTIGRPFAVGISPVTRGEFVSFIDATNHRVEKGVFVWNGKEWSNDPNKSWRDPGFEQEDDHPVVCMSWHDAQAYVGWLRERSGKAYRLLSEAEWEYCCRAGTMSVYSTGGGITSEQANFGTNSKGTTPVARFPLSPWGLRDMHGNVWEWCEDNWHGDYSGGPPSDGSVWPGGDASFRVRRGGSWNAIPRDLRSAFRDEYPPDVRSYDVGFRVARTL
jgi:formylglycine-generating enzyme required for sulfatase activity